MIEIVLKKNDSGHKVFIDEQYDFDKISSVDLDIVAMGLQKLVFDMIKANEKNRKYEAKKKKQSV